MAGYAKLHSGILDSSIWSEDVYTRIVWVAMLAKADAEGRVIAAPSRMVEIANVPRSKFDRAIVKLTSPDPESKTPEHEGRRLISIQGGWQIINYKLYRRMYEGDSVAFPDTNRDTKIYFIRYENTIKIGQSQNPWARLNSLKTSMPKEPILLGYYTAPLPEEKEWHKKWKHLHISREWFKATPELLSEIAKVVNKITTSSYPITTANYDNYNKAEAEAEAIVEEEVKEETSATSTSPSPKETKSHQSTNAGTVISAWQKLPLKAELKQTNAAVILRVEQLLAELDLDPVDPVHLSDVLAGIANYGEALRLPDSQSHQHTILRFLGQHLRKTYLPGVFNLENHKRGNFQKTPAGPPPAKAIGDCQCGQKATMRTGGRDWCRKCYEKDLRK